MIGFVTIGHFCLGDHAKKVAKGEKANSWLGINFLALADIRA